MEAGILPLGKIGPAKLFRWGERNLPVRQQGCALEEAAKFLFADSLRRALLGVGTGHRFVFHRQSLQPDDAKILVTLFPNLALLQLHGWV